MKKKQEPKRRANPFQGEYENARAKEDKYWYCFARARGKRQEAAYLGLYRHWRAELERVTQLFLDWSEK